MRCWDAFVITMTSEWARWRLKSPASRLFTQSFIQAHTDQRKHQSSTSLAFLWGIHRWPVNSPHKGPVTRKMYLFDDVIMYSALLISRSIFAPKNSEKTPGELWGESCEFIVSTKFQISSIVVVFNIVLYSTAIHRVFIIQSSAVIARSNIVRHFINIYRNWDRISIRCCRDTTYLAITGELWGVFCEYLWEKWPRYNGTALHITRGEKHVHPSCIWRR